MYFCLLPPLTPEKEICLLGGVPGSQVKPGRDGALERSFFHEMMVPCPNIVQIQGHVYLGSCRAMIFSIHTWWSCVHWADPHGIFCRLAGIEGTSDKLLLFLKKVVPSTPCILPQSDQILLPLENKRDYILYPREIKLPRVLQTGWGAILCGWRKNKLAQGQHWNDYIATCTPSKQIL